MLFDLKPGDKVNFTNDIGGGTVFKVEGETIVVEDENGIVLHLTWKDVVPVFKPEKDLPTYRSKDSFVPVEKQKKSALESEMTKPVSENFSWDAKPIIKKVKDKAAADIVKDGQSGGYARAVEENEESGIPEIDIHLHEILENSVGMDDYDKLQYQLEYLKKELRRLFRLHKKEAIIIHGVGKGRLRDEVWTLLPTLGFVADFYDATFKKYGAGATHVVLR